MIDIIRPQPNNGDRKRGQVGIGTLIVFIALVLVAAIAAGVLINTAGFLQTQAEQTGEESTSQVSNGISILSATSEVGAASAQDNDVQVLELRVSLRPGSGPVDLTDATVQWIGESQTATFQISAGATNGGGDAYTPSTYFSSNTLTETTNAAIPEASATTLSNPGDRTSIMIYSSDAASIDTVSAGDQLTTGGGTGDLPLKTGDDATININVADGSETTTEINMPRVVSTGEGLSF